MKNFITTFLLIAISVAQAQSSKEYVCTPCGSSCDATIRSKAGTCPECHMALIEKSAIKFANLSIEEMCERLNANPKVVLLDVRSPGEFKGTGFRTYGHFKNAININITQLENRLSELEKYKDSEIIVYCSHSQRSPRASQLLTSSGFKNVSNMAGGVSTLTSQTSNECLKKYYVVH
jgi:rhodanese-related sulfurtransferase/DNA-directed RNA polymerase subunit RPC12/RpoP